MEEIRDGAAITRLLHQWRDGSRDAFEQLVPLVYEELHTLASRRLSREWRREQLQTTAVVNEAYGPAHRSSAVLEPRDILQLARLLDQEGDSAGSAAEYGRFLNLWCKADPGLPELAEARSKLK